VAAILPDNKDAEVASQDFGETTMNLKLTIAATLAAITMFSATAAFAAIGEVNTPANVREGAGTSFDIIGHLDEGDTVNCVDFDDGWCELDDDEGFVAGSLLDFDGGHDDDDDDDHHHHHDHDYDDVDVSVCLGGGGFGGGGFGYGEICIED
jgi:hypothetical protein